MANVRIIYSIATSQPRRVVIADNLPTDQPCAGEANIDLTMDEYVAIGTTPAALGAYVAAITGQPLLPSLYAVVNASGVVTGNIVADPLCGDGYAGCSLIAVDAPIQPQSTYADGVFTPPVSP